MHFMLIDTDPLSDLSGLSVLARLDIMMYVSPNFSILILHQSTFMFPA